MIDTEHIVIGVFATVVCVLIITVGINHYNSDVLENKLAIEAVKNGYIQKAEANGTKSWIKP